MSRPSPTLSMLPLLLILGACSDPPKTETAKQPEKPPEALTGRQAFQRMYPQARSWAPDAEPSELRSIHLAQVKAPPGKAGAWQATFVSASKAKSRAYTYSAVEAAGNLHEGVFGTLEEGIRSASFPIAAIKIDSDQAYEIAAKTSQDYMKKNPGKPVSFVLEQNKRFPEVTWRVIWGESATSSDYSVYVGATLGKYLERVH